LTVIAFVSAVTLGIHWKRASVLLLEIKVILAQSATVKAKVLGKLLQ
jgi:hypothetical protein